MAQTLVQRSHQYPGVSKAFASNVTAGNLILVFVSLGSTVAAPTVSDSRGNTYSLISRVQSNNDNQIAAYYAKNITGGSCTVTASIDVDTGITCYEIAGADKVAPLAAGNSTGGPFPSLGAGALTVSLVTTAACSLYCGWGCEIPGEDYFSSFTASLITQGHDSSHYDADGLLHGVAAGTYAVGANLTNRTRNQVIVAFAIKDAVAAGGPFPHFIRRSMHGGMLAMNGGL